MGQHDAFFAGAEPAQTSRRGTDEAVAAPYPQGAAAVAQKVVDHLPVASAGDVADAHHAHGSIGVADGHAHFGGGPYVAFGVDGESPDGVVADGGVHARVVAAEHGGAFGARQIQAAGCAHGYAAVGPHGERLDGDVVVGRDAFASAGADVVAHESVLHAHPQHACSSVAGKGVDELLAPDDGKRHALAAARALRIAAQALVGAYVEVAARFHLDERIDGTVGQHCARRACGSRGGHVVVEAVERGYAQGVAGEEDRADLNGKVAGHASALPRACGEAEQTVVGAEVACVGALHDAIDLRVEQGHACEDVACAVAVVGVEPVVGAYPRHASLAGAVHAVGGGHGLAYLDVVPYISVVALCDGLCGRRKEQREYEEQT